MGEDKNENMNLPHIHPSRTSFLTLHINLAHTKRLPAVSNNDTGVDYNTVTTSYRGGGNFRSVNQACPDCIESFTANSTGRSIEEDSRAVMRKRVRLGRFRIPPRHNPCGVRSFEGNTLRGIDLSAREFVSLLIEDPSFSLSSQLGPKPNR